MRRPRADYFRFNDHIFVSIVESGFNLQTRGHNMRHWDFLYGRPDSGHQIIRKQVNAVFKSDGFSKVSTQKQSKQNILFSQYSYILFTGKRRSFGHT